jgi:hypothetical protein
MNMIAVAYSRHTLIAEVQLVHHQNCQNQILCDTSQTTTLTEQSSEGVTDLDCIKQCNKLISQYCLEQNRKASTILNIREILLKSPAIKSGRDINKALDAFIALLDNIDSLKTQASKRGHRAAGNLEETEVNQEDSKSENERSGVGQKGSREDTVSEDEDEPSSKCPKTINFSKFPWTKRRTEALASLPQDIRETYKQLENFASDPEVVNDILSTPGCPPCPPSEWLNIVCWKYVDLAKVLNSAHTTKLDPKKTHVIDDEIELALWVSKLSAGIKTSSDHNIAFTMYIKAVAFVFPQHQEYFTQYHTYLSHLFHAMEIRHHSRVIEFD